MQDSTPSIRDREAKHQVSFQALMSKLNNIDSSLISLKNVISSSPEPVPEQPKNPTYSEAITLQEWIEISPRIHERGDKILEQINQIKEILI